MIGICRHPFVCCVRCRHLTVLKGSWMSLALQHRRDCSLQDMNWVIDQVMMSAAEAEAGSQLGSEHVK